MKNADSYSVQSKGIRDTFSDYIELTKPGITFSVLASMAIGFIMATPGKPDLIVLIHALVGTWLTASGTSAHNMFLERRLDNLMQRTRLRPLPSSKISASHGAVFSLSLISLGLIYLTIFVNPVASAVSFATTMIYLLVYTPLKRITALNVYIGAIPGALPVVGGWAAATGTLSDPGMWILFGVIFLWQIPHVMSIGWICKDDYEHAGFQMLPRRDPKGLKTSFWMMIPTMILLPANGLIYTSGMGSWLFLSLSLLTTLFFLWYTIRFLMERDRASARKVMFFSFVYLPLIWAYLLLDRIVLSNFLG
ncbi:MAG: protoheme IX farnesyltransferase [Bacteroidetes bacterium]|jgi:protoheme IX farnesyltransferase|nr:protoheme IX farnesyltransferase [Bacteroidota bacterium]PTM13623.1 MAG: protoheme IX farnesyltransferase [Bacteroidota bacterium]